MLVYQIWESTIIRNVQSHNGSSKEVTSQGGKYETAKRWWPC
jgi:hypothetical protein